MNIKITTIMLSLLATQLFAETAPLDLNKEKEIFFGKVFNIYDTNHDAKLSFDEYTNYLKEQQQRAAESQANAMLKKCDKNGNNTIDKSEITSEDSMFKMLEGKSTKRMEEICPLSSIFAKAMDSNGDHAITKQEIIDSMIKPKKLFSAFPKNIPLDSLKHFPMKTRVAMALEQCDQDKDTKLTPKELTACKFNKSVFKEFDHNKDGVIERQDLIDIQQQKLFDIIDNNRDKSIDKNEFFENLEGSCKI